MASAVFVSFHDGDGDTREGFIDILSDFFSYKGISVFHTGESRPSDRFQAITRSRFFIVLLSKSYASSIRCLRELVEIFNCVESSPRHVLPLFYDVNPSEVRYQNGCYDKAFAEHEKRFREHKQRMKEVQIWREALTRVVNLPRWYIRNGFQYEELQDIVQYTVDILGPESTLGNKTIYQDNCEVSYKELSPLMRLRDFISLLLTYPVKLEENGILRSWISAFPEWKLLLTDGYPVMYEPWNLLTKKALKCMKGFMPVEIMTKIENGERSIFNCHNDVIPEAVLHLTVDLAVNQLIQNLFSGDYSARYIRLLTRNMAEKGSVVNKIVAALEDNHNMFGIDKDFLRAVWINASTWEIDAEVRVQEEINMIMEVRVQEEINMIIESFSMTEGDNMLSTLHIDEKMGSNRHLVIVVDVDSNKKLDLQKVHFPTGIVVFITTESSAQAVKDDDFGIKSKMDLNIWTQDHLLPWKLFCSHAGICSSSSTVLSSMAIEKVAVEIVRECHSHLLAIVLVANHLKYVKDVKYWELVLEKLSSPNSFYDYQDCDRIGISRVMVNAFVNIIWEDIDDDQKLYLDLSLAVHNIKNGVSDKVLVSDWAKMIFPYTQELGERRRQLQYYIEELLDCFVLLKFESEDVYLPTETYDIIKLLHISKPSIIRHGALGLTKLP